MTPRNDPGRDGTVHDISEARGARRTDAEIDDARGAGADQASAAAAAGVPAHVAAAFQADDRQPAVPLGAAWDNGWRLGTVALSRAVGPHTTWSARVRERLEVDGLRVVRPVRATDGRFLAAGWRASQFVEGEPGARVDETAAAALRLEAALVAGLDDGLPLPESDPEDVFCAADRAAWSTHEPRVLAGVEDGLHRDLLLKLRAAMGPLAGPAVPCHADMLATTVYAPGNPPALTDLVGVMHPRGYTAAQVIVDGLLAGAVDAGVIARFRHVPDLHQLLVRAAAYRVWVHVLLSRPEPAASAALAEVVDLLLSRPGGTL